MVPCLTQGQIGLILKAFGLLAGGCAFVVGLRQYSKAQAWKRHEFVASEMRSFNADPLTRNAMQMIDWGTRRIELFPAHPEYASRFQLVTRDVLHTALTTHDKIGRAYTATEAAIRDAFDAFLGGLERFEQFMQAGLVESSEFEPYLAYWIRAICEDVNPQLRGLLEGYVRFYRFDRVPALFMRYNRAFGQGVTSAANVAEVQDKYEAFLASEARPNDVLGLK
ncbi:MAG: hypothetical protein U0Q12_26395 [Vicinamibacterales bacterium]